MATIQISEQLREKLRADSKKLGITIYALTDIRLQGNESATAEKILDDQLRVYRKRHLILKKKCRNQTETIDNLLRRIKAQNDEIAKLKIK
jgi:hypothetical protein